MMLDAIAEEHCSRWSGIPQDGLLHDHRTHIEILCRALATGPWNVPTNWQKAEHRDWGHRTYSRFTLEGSLSTFDSDHLTRLVILAHEHCVRVEINPHTFRHLSVAMWSGRSRTGGMSERHPTIEQAIEAIRPRPGGTP